MGLTPEQRESLWTPDDLPFRGQRVVSARPGTGKTTTLSEYCIDLVENWQDYFARWQGMAIISYTNIAKQEIEAKLQILGRARDLLSSPHFIGTIDSFLNQHVFLPFGAKKMGYEGGRPKLVGEPYGTWFASQQMKDEAPKGAVSPSSFDCFTLGPDDRPVRTTVDAPPGGNGHPLKLASVATNGGRNISAMKEYVWTHGFASQSDANYLAFAALRDSENLAKAFISRFPIVVIDEAQDMTAVQHAFIDYLKLVGHPHIVLIGDEYQAIYEWNTAKPQLFVDKKNSVGDVWSPRTITQTFRCSPAICSALSRMAPEGEELRPANTGKNRKYEEQVKTIAYSAASQGTQIRSAIDDLASLLSEKSPHSAAHGEVLTLAVLTRSRNDVGRLRAFFADEVVTDKKPVKWDYRLTRDYLRILHHLLLKDLYGAFGAYEAFMYNAGNYKSKSSMRTELMSEWELARQDEASYRAAILDDLGKIRKTLPTKPEINLADCDVCCVAEVRGISRARLNRMKRDCQAFKNARIDQDRSLSSFFAASSEHVYVTHEKYNNVRLVFSTVHGVKGETYDGVLYYVKEATYPACGCRPSRLKWSEILKHDLVGCEAKRITYVALSRAAQVLWLVVPEKDKQLWDRTLDIPSGNNGELFDLNGQAVG